MYKFVSKSLQLIEYYIYNIENNNVYLFILFCLYKKTYIYVGSRLHEAQDAEQ